MTHSSAFRWEIVWKRVEIGDILNFVRTVSTGVERTRPVMALTASNCTLKFVGCS